MWCTESSVSGATMRIEVGKRYKLRDKGSITVESRLTCTETGADVMRCRSETGEVLMYDRRGHILPVDGGRELGRFTVEQEVHANT